MLANVDLVMPVRDGRKIRYDAQPATIGALLDCSRGVSSIYNQVTSSVTR
ncbi:hypothetical protein OS189_13750 [Sulfitobacter sp. F26169L]|nr:hypothetical protein [Sulfitobacter sp. F26169L]MCX7567410.1 hypothetical protein [Sulfitobacter sp. F26169L]